LSEKLLDCPRIRRTPAASIRPNSDSRSSVEISSGAMPLLRLILLSRCPACCLGRCDAGKGLAWPGRPAGFL